MREKLIRECRNLSTSEKKVLVKTLLTQINPATRGRGEQLMDIMESVLGEKVHPRCREQRYVWARTIVANRLLDEGLSTTKAGMELGMDHSSIIYMRKKLRLLRELPGQYSEEIKLYEKFNNAVNTLEHASI